MSYDYIRRMHGTQFEVGMRVRHTVTKKEGAVRPEDQSAGHYVQVRFDGLDHDRPCHPDELHILIPGSALEADAAKASFEEDHRLDSRSHGRDRTSQPTTEGAEGRNWAGE